MKKTLFVLLLLFSFWSFSQEIRYVNTTNGLNVRSGPNSSSNKIAKFDCGTKLEIIEKSGIKLHITDNQKKIWGEWVVVKKFNSETIGFVFDAYLIKDKPILYYSINELEAQVFEQPSFDSKKLFKIPKGKSIIIDKKIETDDKFIISKDFSLSGFWIKLKGINGYVFSSDFTKFKPKFYDLGVVITNIHGQKLNDRIEKKTRFIGGKSYEVVTEITEFKNGTYEYSFFDDCYKYVYIYKNVTLSEVYHQMVSEYCSKGEINGNKKIYMPEFYKKIGNEYRFGAEGLISDLKIISNEDGTFIISSYSC